MRFSSVEIRDLLKALAAVSLAFTFARFGLTFDSAFLSGFALFCLTVGVGFLGHELAHKFVAQRYGCFAEFRSNDQMLVLALMFSLLGFVFAAPGAVLIFGNVTPKKNGIISSAGIVANIVAALMFLAMAVTTRGLLAEIGQYGLLINSWLALFNLIPFGNFDGAKVLVWDKRAFGILLVLSCVLVFLVGYGAV